MWQGQMWTGVGWIWVLSPAVGLQVLGGLWMARRGMWVMCVEVRLVSMVMAWPCPSESCGGPRP